MTLFGSSNKEHITENLGGVGWDMNNEDIKNMQKNYNGQIFVSDAIPLG